LLGLDPSRAMLARGLSRFSPPARRRLLAVQGEAAALPFPDSSLDCVISQFVWRNLPSRPQALTEIRRVLKPGGQLLILEFGCGRKRIWGGLYNFYLCQILPRLAALLSPRKNAYDYLVKSILAFPPPEAITEELRAAGFTSASHHPLSSGIVSLYAASGGGPPPQL
jgi:Methylase involved in ubiquinone/menaquinone biosynthesis